MLIDAEAIPRPDIATKRYDVCVVGAGPAGIALARKLAFRKLKVALMEAGGLEISADSQECYEGSVIGADYAPLDTARLRFLGGSSNHWEGVVVPLQDYDYQPSAQNPLGGWPISGSALSPYFEDAIAFLSAKRMRPNDALSLGGQPIHPYSAWESVPASRTGAKYLDSLKRDELIDLYINANLVDLKLSEDRTAVVEGTCRAYSNPAPFGIFAKHYALCAGGIENARLLLAFNKQIDAGIGNQNGQVGSYFQDHPHFRVGRIVYNKAKISFSSPYAIYIPSVEFMKSNKSLNFGIYVSAPAAPSSFPKRMARGIACSADFMISLAEALAGKTIDCDPSSEDVTVAIEPKLNPNSRVLLNRNVDRFGLPRVSLDWKYSEQDYATTRAAIFGFGKLAAETDVGRVQVVDWLGPEGTKVTLPSGMIGGFHHMCTTRMSDDPKTGVVDGNCKVHGIGNLYIGGSSVFASGGFANPTLTLVQLAMRLGDHISVA